MQARIYRPSRTATQSGQANTRKWMLEFEQSDRRELDPLMGWTSSRDMRQQLRIAFDTRDEAIAYAERCGLGYTVEEPAESGVQPKSYADNFRSDRLEPWTH